MGLFLTELLFTESFSSCYFSQFVCLYSTTTKTLNRESKINKNPVDNLSKNPVDNLSKNPVDNLSDNDKFMKEGYSIEEEAAKETKSDNALEVKVEKIEINGLIFNKRNDEF